MILSEFQLFLMICREGNGRPTIAVHGECLLDFLTQLQVDFNVKLSDTGQKRKIPEGTLSFLLIRTMGSLILKAYE